MLIRSAHERSALGLSPQPRANRRKPSGVLGRLFSKLTGARRLRAGATPEIKQHSRTMDQKQQVSDKNTGGITPQTRFEALEKFSDAELASALRTYRKSAKCRRIYRHICRLISAEQKRRKRPVFEDVRALRKEAS